MRWLIFILLIPNAKADALLDAIYANWDKTEVYDKDDNSDFVEDHEAEVYHWELGTPDNIPEIEIIYTDENPCEL